MTRPPVLRLTLEADEMIVDNFAGGGGASTGIIAATGRAPDIAVNHDPEALAVYKANHPSTRIMCEDVFDVVPRFVVGGKRVGLAWFSPDCTFFSKARGAKPFRDRAKARRRRGLAGVALKWAEQVRPRVVLMENVEEFKDWGPIGDDGLPDKTRKGENFQRYIARWRNLGYNIEWNELRACDFGAPTTRKRLFLYARCDGKAIAWPEPTHGPGRKPYRTAAECIDWSIPCPSIFTRKKPLADATLRRIARGIMKYIVNSDKPFVVPLGDNVAAPLMSPVKTWGGGGNDAQPANQPMRTVTTSKRGEHAIVTPVLAPMITKFQQNSLGQPPDKPLDTVMAGATRFGLVAPTLVQMCWGERPGQAPRCLDLHVPLGTIMAEGNKHGLVTAELERADMVAGFIAKHFGGEHANGEPKAVGSALHKPLSTVTVKDHNHLVAANIVKLKGTCKDGQSMDEPLATVQAQGLHYAQVCAFLVKYYKSDGKPDQAQGVDEPLHTVPTKARFAIVTVRGIDYAIVDIGMRMLDARELYNAQGFPPDYRIDIDIEKVDKRGKVRKTKLTKTAQIHKCGNAVPPPFSEALVLAAFTPKQKEAVA